MPSHHFTLIIDGADAQSDEVIDALFECGCDDGTVGRVDGIQFVVFDREAPSLEEAVLSAIVDVERNQGLEVVRLADAGLVSMADIAARLGRSRESVRLLISGARGPGGFPAPVTDPRSRYRLWRWLDVERWLKSRCGEDTDSANDLLLAAINAGLEFRQHVPRLGTHVQNSVRSLAGMG